MAGPIADIPSPRYRPHDSHYPPASGKPGMHVPGEDAEAAPGGAELAFALRLPVPAAYALSFAAGPPVSGYALGGHKQIPRRRPPGRQSLRLCHLPPVRRWPHRRPRCRRHSRRISRWSVRAALRVDLHMRKAAFLRCVAEPSARYICWHRKELHIHIPRVARTCSLREFPRKAPPAGFRTSSACPEPRQEHSPEQLRHS